MMTTPSDHLTDVAVGFSISEGILAGANELLELEVQENETGIRVSMTITSERFAALQTRRRNTTGRTWLWLCGVDDLTQARPLPRGGRGVSV
jgi:formate dehydrogenase accessory protein FdhD